MEPNPFMVPLYGSFLWFLFTVPLHGSGVVPPWFHRSLALAGGMVPAWCRVVPAVALTKQMPRIILPACNVYLEWLLGCSALLLEGPVLSGASIFITK